MELHLRTFDFFLLKTSGSTRRSQVYGILKVKKK